jgi:hypothetical protein
MSNNDKSTIGNILFKENREWMNVILDFFQLKKMGDIEQAKA